MKRIFAFALLVLPLAACQSTSTTPQQASVDHKTEGRHPTSVTVACRGLNSSQEYPPYVKFEVLDATHIANLQFHGSEEVDFLPKKSIAGPVEGQYIASKHGPYFGNYEYIIAEGYRFILPTIGENFPSMSIKGGANDPRQNAVLDVSPGNLPGAPQGGDEFLRMHCEFE